MVNAQPMEPTGVVHQALLGFDKIQGLSVVASSNPDPAIQNRWTRQIEPRARLAPDGVLACPDSALSFFHLPDNSGVVLRRFATGHSPGRNNSHALIYPPSHMSASIALRLYGWTGWRSDATPGLLEALPLQELGDEARSDPEPATLGLGAMDALSPVVCAILASPDCTGVTVVGWQEQERITLLQAFLNIVNLLPVQKLRSKYGWTFSTYETDHREQADLPRICCMASRPTASIPGRVLVDLAVGTTPGADRLLALAQEVVSEYAGAGTLDSSTIKAIRNLTAKPTPPRRAHVVIEQPTERVHTSPAHADGASHSVQQDRPPATSATSAKITTAPQPSVEPLLEGLESVASMNDLFNAVRGLSKHLNEERERSDAKKVGEAARDYLTINSYFAENSHLSPISSWPPGLYKELFELSLGKSYAGLQEPEQRDWARHAFKDHKEVRRALPDLAHILKNDKGQRHVGLSASFRPAGLSTLLAVAGISLIVGLSLGVFFGGRAAVPPPRAQDTGLNDGAPTSTTGGVSSSASYLPRVDKGPFADAQDPQFVIVLGRSPALSNNSSPPDEYYYRLIYSYPATAGTHGGRASTVYSVVDACDDLINSQTSWQCKFPVPKGASIPALDVAIIVTRHGS